MLLFHRTMLLITYAFTLIVHKRLIKVLLRSYLPYDIFSYLSFFLSFGSLPQIFQGFIKSSPFSRVHHLLDGPRPTDRNDALQDLRLHHYESSLSPRARPQTRPLHESPSSRHVHGPNNCYLLVISCPNRCNELGSRLHLQYLRS